MKPIYTIIIAVVVALVAGGGAFFAGTAYGEAQAQNTRSEFLRNRGFGGNGQTATGQNGQAGQNGQNGQFARPAAFGTVKSVSGNTIVLTMQDGSTVTVTVNAQTTYQKTDSGSLSDVQPGERLTVTSDQTGANITARGIQIRPNGPTAQQ